MNRRYLNTLIVSELRCMGYTSNIFFIFTKGENFCDLLLTSLFAINPCQKFLQMVNANVIFLEPAHFYAPVTIVRGHQDLPVCLSVCSSHFRV